MCTFRVTGVVSLLCGRSLADGACDAATHGMPVAWLPSDHQGFPMWKLYWWQGRSDAGLAHAPGSEVLVLFSPGSSHARRRVAWRVRWRPVRATRWRRGCLSQGIAPPGGCSRNPCGGSACQTLGFTRARTRGAGVELACGSSPPALSTRGAVVGDVWKEFFITGINFWAGAE